MLSKLRQAPRLIQSARDNIKDTPGIYAKVGLETLRGAQKFIEHDLPRAFAGVADLHLLGDLADASVDLALLSQALHHAGSPAAALSEAVRIVTPGGRVLVLDLRAHREEWVKARLGDRCLGFADEELRQLLCAAGLERVQIRVGARRTGDPFTVLIASGLKKARRPVAATQYARNERRRQRTSG